MPEAPSPITSTPPVPGQPYDASAPGPGQPSQSAAEQVYGTAGGAHAADPWPKVQDGGAASMTTGEAGGGWPGNGSSTDGGWKQT